MFRKFNNLCIKLVFILFCWFFIVLGGWWKRDRARHFFCKISSNSTEKFVALNLCMQKKRKDFSYFFSSCICTTTIENNMFINGWKEIAVAYVWFWCSRNKINILKKFQFTKEFFRWNFLIYIFALKRSSPDKRMNNAYICTHNHCDQLLEFIDSINKLFSSILQSQYFSCLSFKKKKCVCICICEFMFPS